ncbi:MAG: hypothetical protein IJI12_02085 [Atopobiaceae bacterium]|nr:hypothetical protein [Atopobiaceae bacterium]
MNYLQAIPAVIQAAGLVADGIKFLVANSEDIAKSMQSLATMLDAAKGLMSKAADVVPIDELLHQAEEADDADQPGENVQPQAADAPKPKVKVPGFLVQAKDKAVGFADEQKAGFERKKLEQEMAKAVHASRRKVLGSATITFSMKQLAEQLASSGEGDAIAGLGVLDLPGCFAIARYGKVELGKDPAAFTGIYIGKDSCVGEGIARTIAPTGNADVYADIKYKQNVMVYVFTWPADKLDEKYDALVQLFAAGESYNRVEMGVPDEELVAE